MHIKGFEDVIAKNTLKTDFPLELQVHKLSYTLGHGSQYSVNIIAENFETAMAIIEKKYGQKKGFNIYQYEVGRPENSVHVISPVMEKKILEALLRKYPEDAVKQRHGLISRLTGKRYEK
jgi:hypothetical protein